MTRWHYYCNKCKRIYYHDPFTGVCINCDYESFHNANKVLMMKVNNYGELECNCGGLMYQTHVFNNGEYRCDSCDNIILNPTI